MIVAPSQPDDTDAYWVADTYDAGANTAFITAARTDTPALVTLARAVLDLHTPQTWWGNTEQSITDATYQADPSAYQHLTSFQACAECARLEQAAAVRANLTRQPIRDARWPCATVQAITTAWENHL